MTNDFMSHHHHIVVDEESKKLAKEAAKVSADNDNRLNKLEAKVNALSVMNEALFRLLAAQPGIDESALKGMMETIVADRKVRQEMKLICGECNMQVPASREKCLYCGGKIAGVVSKTLFDL